MNNHLRLRLRLHVEKGPRKGQVIECNGKNKISIGRIVKGNTFAIKEDAISQKHLLIEQNRTNKWTVRDLDTSNGTVLNNAKVLPHKPRILKNGDLIKIGAETIIRVQTEPHSEPSHSPERKTLKRKRGDSKPNVAAQNPNPGATQSQSLVGSAETVADTAGKVNNVEEMSLAQWFNQMEQWLPKHLNEACENVCKQMREQCDQFDAYVLQRNDQNDGH